MKKGISSLNSSLLLSQQYLTITHREPNGIKEQFCLSNLHSGPPVNIQVRKTVDCFNIIPANDANGAVLGACWLDPEISLPEQGLNPNADRF